MTDIVPTIPHISSIADWLEEMYQVERQAFHIDVRNFKSTETLSVEEVRANFFETMQFAMVAEIVEMSDEVGWKPWVSPRGGVNREAAADEVADLMFFLGHWINAAGLTANQVCEAIRTKITLNYERQAKGDDGESRRCPKCRRSLDQNHNLRKIHTPEPALQRSIERTVCAGCGYIIDEKIVTMKEMTE